MSVMHLKTNILEVGPLTEFGMDDGFLSGIDSIQGEKHTSLEDWEVDAYFNVPEDRTDEEIEAFLMRYADWKGNR